MSKFQDGAKQGGVGEEVEQIHGHYTEEQQSAEKLTDELSEWLSNVSEDSFDENELDRILNQLNKIEPIEDIDTESELERLHQQFDVLFEEAQEALEQEEARSAEVPPVTQLSSVRKTKTIRRLVPLVAAIAILFATLITAQALGIDVIGGIARWTSEVFSLGNNQNINSNIVEITQRPIQDGEERSYSALQDALDDFGVTGKIAPKWIPERFQQAENIEIFANANPYISIGAYYIVSDDEIFSFAIHEKSEDSPFSVEKDEREPRSLVINNQVFYIFNNYNAINAVWANGNVEGYIVGHLTEEELNKVLKSIYE